MLPIYYIGNLQLVWVFVFPFHPFETDEVEAVEVAETT